MVYVRKKSGLGYFLLQKGIITKQQLLKAMEYQSLNAGKRMGEILCEIDILAEEELLEQLADYMKVKYVILYDSTYSLDKQNLFDKKMMLDYVFAPIDISEKIISVAINDINSHELKERIESMAKGYKVQYFLSLPSIIKEFIKESYARKVRSLSFIPKRERFGEYLIRKGIVSDEQVREVLQYQRKYLNKRLGELLCEMGILGHEQALIELAEYAGKNYESLEGIIPRQDLVGFFDNSFMAKNNFATFEKEGNTVKIAISNIFDFELIDIVESRMKRESLNARFYISSKESIQTLLSSLIGSE
jgi:hypothetical protein